MMKYHKKTRQFCENIFKDKETKLRMQATVMNTIRNEEKTDISLKKLLEKFGEDYGVKGPKEAIPILEILYEYFGSDEMYEYFDASEKFGYYYRISGRRLLFNDVFNSMVKTAKDKNNTDLLKFLESYTELIECHDKAKELYESRDSDRKYCCCIIDRMIRKAENKGKYPMKTLMLEIGFELVSDDPKTAIVFLEATYEALKIQKNYIEKNKLNVDENGKSLSIDELFSQAFYCLYERARLRPLNNKAILEALEEYYPWY